ncbi:Predicted DNA-binding transcriptional regulator YafY, contains an HTH and WYL domains [Actinokineospora alba]|uniref:Predicted DNA-binding transcriptional regulator YafY, contains an HTH and WYL domains n=1 Tax=Actinokineospora alba TaxID=504798 RepID=A0A1H0PJR0_9PSEU|nr:WYL domain-containing protein [Actinokineospora alba]TDP65831.1 putative DNA-binding transcriptional regulator YafY [Actinokineospora alba]SDI64158.1 Predicted DNA-binding transcriptional regulator YafY, contains an HTH and WYL domains [Actinokineospora alba]SDP05307.1 Predicted DNA-binding transcriptional regulator YafY, contains an HTH and WYL domains [Actinokineospora alba]
MRASRLVSLLLLLQTRGRLTAQELATELEVSIRTVYRDVDALHAAGIPLYGSAGPAGGYQLLGGYRSKLTGLTSDEAESLFLMPGPAAELGLGSVVAAAQLKMVAALPEELRDRAGRISSRFHLDTPGWYDSDQTPHLAAVAGSVWNQRVIDVRYRRWKTPREVTRTLRPYGVVLKAGRWYLVAHGSTTVSTYRVSAILDLEVSTETFDRPDFDLVAYWKSYVEEFLSWRLRGTATVALSPRGMERMPDILSTEAVRAIEETGEPGERPLWTRAVIPVESPSHTVSDLLRMGADIEVIEPPELRQLFAETTSELARLYA